MFSFTNESQIHPYMCKHFADAQFQYAQLIILGDYNLPFFISRKIAISQLVCISMYVFLDFLIVYDMR